MLSFFERDEHLTVTQRSVNPPKFLLRMEARAEARRERIKLAEESRRRKLMEQERKEEAARIEEEQKKRRLQQEVRQYSDSAESSLFVQFIRHLSRIFLDKSQTINTIGNCFSAISLDGKNGSFPLSIVINR